MSSRAAQTARDLTGDLRSRELAAIGFVTPIFVERESGLA